jgi:hypothetical protein
VLIADLISLLSQVGKKDAPADPDDLAYFVRRPAGILIEYFGVSQLHYIGSWPPSGLPPRLCGCPAGGGALGAEFPFHLMDSAHHRQETATGGGAGVDIFA